MGKGDSSNFKIEWDKGFSLPGEFKLDHLQPIKPLLFPNFYISFTFILGGQFLLPQRSQRTSYEKRNSPNSRNGWMIACRPDSRLSGLSTGLTLCPWRRWQRWRCWMRVLLEKIIALEEPVWLNGWMGRPTTDNVHRTRVSLVGFVVM